MAATSINLQALTAAICPQTAYIACMHAPRMISRADGPTVVRAVHSMSFSHTHKPITGEQPSVEPRCSVWSTSRNMHVLCRNLVLAQISSLLVPSPLTSEHACTSERRASP